MRLCILIAGFSLATFSQDSSARADTTKAEPCDPLTAPVSVSLRDTGFDKARSACATNSWTIGVRGGALIDTANFYGTAAASLFLDWRKVHSTGFEFGVGVRLVDARFVQSAVFSDTQLNVGPLHLSIAKPRLTSFWGKQVMLSHALRVDIPLTSTSTENLTVAASPSLGASLALTSSLHLHSRIAALLWSSLPESGADSQAAVLSSFDLGFAPSSYFSLLVGSEVQGGWHGIRLDHLQARAGLRVSAGGKRAVELSAGQVLAGNEGGALVVWLGYRSSEVPKTKKKSSRLKDWMR